MTNNIVNPVDDGSPESEPPVNHRLARLQNEARRAQEHLGSYQSELIERETDPDFQKAHELFEEGWRIANYTWYVKDSDAEVYGKSPDGNTFYYADGTSSHTEELLHAMGLTEDDEDVAYYISDLCEEHGLSSVYGPSWSNEQ